MVNSPINFNPRAVGEHALASDKAFHHPAYETTYNGRNSLKPELQDIGKRGPY